MSLNNNINMKCKQRGETENIILIEYGYDSTEHYDGISEIKCQECGARTGRWTNKIIKDGYIESKFGKNGHVKEK